MDERRLLYIDTQAAKAVEHIKAIREILEDHQFSFAEGQALDKELRTVWTLIASAGTAARNELGRLEGGSHD